MKFTRILVLAAIVIFPQICLAQKTATPNRAWRPFWTSFRAAVNKRDRDALTKMMTADFYYLSSGGDENGNQDTRDEAFEYWNTSSTDVWQSLDRIIAQGTVPKTAMRELGGDGPSKIGPPIANNARAIRDRKFDWFAIFEFKDGRWYWTAFAECCD